MQYRFILPCVILAFFLSALAAPLRADFGEQSKIDLSATTDVSSLPAGGSGTIAVSIDMAPQWHIQSAHPLDDSLIASVLTMAKTPGVTFGDVQYPMHQAIRNPAPPPAFLGIYEDHIVILVPFTIAADAKPGAITLKGGLFSQACNDENCNGPVTTPFTVNITVTAAGTAPVAQNAAIFAAAAKQKWFEAATKLAATNPAPATSTAPGHAAANDSGKPGKQISLLSDDEQIAIIKARPYKPFNTEEFSLPIIILSALLGGAILNIMPCVLPVIPLKVLGLVQQAHGDRKLAILHGLMFSAGIITLFVALAVVLKIAGLFYGQQFQSPVFLIAMAFIVLALALSMLGVWTIQTPQAVYKVDQGHSGFLGSFSGGLLATLLATPCSAPYLGPVLGWALLQPAWVTALALGLVGVGMSLPYLVLAAFPGLLKKMPKAGRWSELLKQGLGIVMIGVGVYLILLLPNSTFWPFVFYGAVVLGLVCWGWGQIPTGAMEVSTVWTIRSIVLVLGIAAGTGIFFWGANTVNAGTKPEPEAGWTPFNVALLDDALKSGRPVVVDWGANWCINCRVLEATVLRAKDTENAFVASNALLLRADETILNPPTTALNEKLGGKSIPVLAIFSPAHPYTPVVLRDKYTAETVINELKKAAGKN